MQGGTTEADKTIEFGLDLSKLLSDINLNQDVKVFLQVVEDDPGNAYSGETAWMNISILNLRQEVEKQEVIFLMIIERFPHKFDWTFIDQLYALYTHSWLKDPVYENINKTMQVGPWYGDIINRAALRHISLEEALIEEGKFLFYRNDTVNYLINYGQDHFSRIISDNPVWMEHVRGKAIQKGIPLKEMIRLDAEYMWEQKLKKF